MMQRLAAGKVIVVGALNLDVIAVAERTLNADDSSPGAVRLSAGGVARNIAEGLSRLSVNCRFHSLAGEDLAGDQVLDLCRAAGLATDAVVRCKNLSTPVYVSLNDHSGTMLHAVSDMALLDACSDEHFPTLQADIESSDLCIVDANLPVDLIKQIAAYSAHVPLVAEAVSVSKCQRLVNVLPSLDLLKVNYKEALQLAGVGRDVSVEQLAAALLALGPATVLMTLGADGVLAATRDGGRLSTHFEPAPAANVVSINGAGDAMLAGFVAARLAGLDVPAQLQWGVEAARLSLESANACSERLTLKHLQRL